MRVYIGTGAVYTSIKEGRNKGRKAQAIQEEDKTRGKATDKKQSYTTGLLNQPIKPRVQNVKTRFSPRRQLDPA